MPKLTQERLKELLRYDPITGIFTRLKTVSNNGKKGTIAGGVCKINGYRRIVVDYKIYIASRLAWLYMEGYLPENEIDHRNRIKHDDRWENLRHVSHQCNVRNSGISKNNKSGITGVSLHKTTQKWQADIRPFGKTVYLGIFNSKLDAAIARWKAEVKYGFPGCNSTSSALLYIQKHGNNCAIS